MLGGHLSLRLEIRFNIKKCLQLSKRSVLMIILKKKITTYIIVLNIKFPTDL